MFRNLIQLYSMAICFVASFILMITISLTINSITNSIFTEYKYHSELGHFSTNEKYIIYNPTLAIDIKNNPSKLTQARSADRENYIKEKKVSSIHALMSQASWLITASLFLIVHWRLYKKHSII